MRRGARQPDLVHPLQRLGQVGLDAVEGHHLVDDAAGGAFGAAAVVAHDVDHEGVLELPQVGHGHTESLLFEPFPPEPP